MTLHDYEVLQADNSVARFVTFAGSPFERQNNFEGAQYIQDHWAVRDNLTIEAGVRAEWNDIVRDLEIAPRFSVAWAPHRLGGTKFSAGYGVYYDAINLALIGRTDETSLSTFYLPGGVVEGPVPTSFTVNDHAFPRRAIKRLAQELSASCHSISTARPAIRTGKPTTVSCLRRPCRNRAPSFIQARSLCCAIPAATATMPPISP